VATAPQEPGPRRDRCTTPDGLNIAVYDFGGRGDDLLLVHATGFCAEVFGPLARALSPHFHCWGLDLRAHGRSDRPADGNFAWSGFCTDVLTVVDHLGLTRPFAFGHSCGGAAVLLAEQARAGSFTALHCFEPVVFDEPPGGLVFDNPLSDGARRRRQSFPTAAEALANFSSKPPLADLDPEVLRRYVECGFETVPSADGGDGRAVRLRCHREDEAEVYANGASHGAYGHLPEIGCPVVLSCGEHTDAFGLPYIEADASRIPRSTVRVIPGVGHFGPLENPPLVATAVLDAWEPLTGTPRS
jgi:pimeloyl-ACP methyl ester carboxylesterase